MTRFAISGGGSATRLAPERVGWRRGEPDDKLKTREWLVTNGLGGYASGAIGRDATRKYHGVLMAPLAGVHGRAMLLNDVEDDVQLEGGARFVPGAPETLVEMRLVCGLPVWTSSMDGLVLEKRVLMPHRQNTTLVAWHVASARAPVTLRVRPWIHFRRHEEPLSERAGAAHSVTVEGGRCTIQGLPGLPPLEMAFDGGVSRRVVLDEGRKRTVTLEMERARGYAWKEVQWSPGVVEIVVAPGDEVALVASAESWEHVQALRWREAWDVELERRALLVAQAHPKLRDGPGAELVLAADQFLIEPIARAADTAGHAARTTIAGYPWFTDWGRDTMISLEGLALSTGRRHEAEAILRTFAHYVKDGLIPNMFPEGDMAGRYNTADATLWFFHAIDRYTELSGDRDVLRWILPILEGIVDEHVRGTRFGIGVDPKDGLLTQGAEGLQLTWMDAKVDDWVVTPRRGKAVEINALWYNALRLVERWSGEERGPASSARWAKLAARARASFNARFWNESTGCLFDVVDRIGGEGGDDPTLRPNQLLAVSLPQPVLEPSRWRPVVEIVREQLLTEVGLRSLAPSDPEYAPRYDGDLRARDAAYHQGTVWAWLLGPFVDAWRKVHPDDDATRFLESLFPELGEACLGTIGEIFDAEPPYTPRGCVAQAWSVAEAIRALAR
jgi:predicted glycogen debranching enzyme